MSEATERLMERVDINDAGCWLWKLARNSTGYGLIKYHGRQRIAHRFAYEAFLGPIPDGLQLDHLCRVRHCVNPAHLDPVTPAENTRRGMAPNVVAMRRGSCQRGHSLTDPENVYVTPSGKRRCRECHRLRHRSQAKRAAT